MKILLLVVSLVALLGSGTAFHGNDPCGNDLHCNPVECTCRAYVFGLPLICPWVFVDPDTAEIYGPFVDIIKKVCDLAGRLCDFAIVDQEDCWDGSWSNVLNNQWFDACMNPFQVIASETRYNFIECGLTHYQNPGIWARANTNITASDLMSVHDYSLGWMANPSDMMDMLLDDFLNAGFFVKDKNIIRLEGDMKSVLTQQFDALLSGCENSGIDFVIWPADLVPPGNYTLITTFEKDMGTTGLMMRKDDKCFLKWFNAALKECICCEDYPEWCAALAVNGDRTDYCFPDREEKCANDTMWG